MEIIHRRQVVTTSNEVENNDVIELHVKDIAGPIATVLALSLSGSVSLSADDLAAVTKALIYSDKVDISAAAEAPSPRRRVIDVAGMNARAGLNRQLVLFPDGEVTGEDILKLVNQRGGTALLTRDQDGVIDEIHASFDTAYRLPEGELTLDLEASGTTVVGDMAQTSILTSTGQEQILALAEWSISWKRKTVESTNTDFASYESNRGSTRSWTAKAKYMVLIGDGSQQDAVLSAIDPATPDLMTWNFFFNVASGSPAFQGNAIGDGIDFGAGTGKIVGLDVSLKGDGVLKRLSQVAPIANPNTVTGQTAQV